MLMLTNTFHHTRYHTRKTREEIDSILQASPDQRTEAERAWIRKVAYTLCPSSGHGCKCGRNEINERE